MAGGTVNTPTDRRRRPKPLLFVVMHLRGIPLHTAHATELGLTQLTAVSCGLLITLQKRLQDVPSSRAPLLQTAQRL